LTLAEQSLLTIAGAPVFTAVVSGNVTRYLVICVMFYRPLFVLLSFLLCHWIVCPFVLFTMSLNCLSFCPIYYVIELFVLLSYLLCHWIVCPFVLFTLSLNCLSFLDLRLLITSLVSSNFYFPSGFRLVVPKQMHIPVLRFSIIQ
jgi:hypothetical protein